MKWDFREDMMDIGMRCKSKFTGTMAQDVEILRKELNDHYDQLIRWREEILNTRAARMYHEAANEGIKSLRDEKQKMDSYFRSAREEVERLIDILRNTTTT